MADLREKEQGGTGLEEYFAPVLERKEDFVAQKIALRRQNIRNNRDAMDGVIDCEIARDMYDEGFIKWRDALVVDHFATLNRGVQDELIDLFRLEIEDLFAEYTNINDCIELVLSNFDSSNNLAIDALKQAHTVQMTPKEAAQFTTTELNTFLTTNYRENKELVAAFLDEMRIFVNQNDYLNISSLDAMRKMTAREIAQNSLICDAFEYVTRGEASGQYIDSCFAMSESGLSRDVIQHMQQCKVSYACRLQDMAQDILTDRSHSDLVIVEDGAALSQGKTA